MRDRLNMPIRGVLIMVLKKHFHKDFVEQYTARPEDWTECRHFQVGDEFLVPKEIPWQMPEGFCGWAWADIQKLVLDVARGGKDVFLTCCTDGYRPVIFKLEKVEEGAG